MRMRNEHDSKVLEVCVVSLAGCYCGYGIFFEIVDELNFYRAMSYDQKLIGPEYD